MYEAKQSVNIDHSHNTCLHKALKLSTLCSNSIFSIESELFRDLVYFDITRYTIERILSAGSVLGVTETLVTPKCASTASTVCCSHVNEKFLVACSYVCKIH